MISKSIAVNNDGHLTIGGADCVDLAERYGTPLYVFDENLIRSTIAEFRESIKKHYGGNGRVLYASKAFSCKEMYRICRSEGIGADVVSAGEIYTAVSAGFDPSLLVFHGNNKAYDELLYAVKVGVGRIVVDNFSELKNLESIAESLGKEVNIILRIKPGIDVHTHDYIKTGQIDCKFGFALENGEAMNAALECLEHKGVNLKGFHCHIGSQIFTTEPFCDAAKIMIQFAADFRDKSGVTVTEIDLGGGFGVKYVESDDQQPFDSFMATAADALKAECDRLHFPISFVYIEPGRSIVGPAGITLYKVGAIKHIENVRTFVSVDGGMSDNPRYALYNAEYTIEIANKATEPKSFVATVAGKCCESGDLLQEHVKIQQPDVGDTLAVLTTGAYCYSMASNYNRIPRAAVVFVKDKESRVVINRETYEDIIKNDV
ncbi:MAG: diaminopimelate decarboxylase [Ruminococcaceae bacterium]|nr:diaminopimelate decarboxylase [Oscillospiraceae bacterium]